MAQKLPRVDNKAKPFDHVRSELYTTESFISYGLWLVAPAACQEFILYILYQAHCVICVCMNLGCQSAHWSSLHNDIETLPFKLQRLPVTTRQRAWASPGMKSSVFTLPNAYHSFLHQGEGILFPSKGVTYDDSHSNITDTGIKETLLNLGTRAVIASHQDHL